jgi:hypothetical protein
MSATRDSATNEERQIRAPDAPDPAFRSNLLLRSAGATSASAEAAANDAAVVVVTTISVVLADSAQPILPENEA